VIGGLEGGGREPGRVPLLADVTAASERVRELQREQRAAMKEAREELRAVIRVARDEGLSWAAIGRAAGLSRERVRQLYGGG
jgi:hypothetical protein